MLRGKIMVCVIETDQSRMCEHNKNMTSSARVHAPDHTKLIVQGAHLELTRTF